jgi:hypothetical protein
MSRLLECEHWFSLELASLGVRGPVTALVGCDLSQPRGLNSLAGSGVKPPQAKAVTGHRTQKRGRL